MTEINDKKNYKTLYGVVELKESIECKSSVLGCKEPISLGGIGGHLLFPRLPDRVTDALTLLWQPLRPPVPAQTWKQAEQLLYWGRPYSYPTAESEVKRMLLEFSVLEIEAKTTANAINFAFPAWYAMFVDYFELVTKQRLYSNGEIKLSVANLNLFTWNEEGSAVRCHDPIDNTVEITVSDRVSHLNPLQLSEICKYCSSAQQPALAYRIILEAYRAFSAGDYRKAVIEAATAAEIVLGQEIKSTLVKTKVSYADQLLKKYRMLSGRFELAKMVGLGLPELDYKTLLIEPRNEIVHKADFANAKIALSAIGAVDELLACISPFMGENDA